MAAWHWKYVYKRSGPGLAEEGTGEPSYPSEHAAVAGAASRVLSYVFPERPAERFDELAEEAALSRLQPAPTSAAMSMPDWPWVEPSPTR